jgi:hypothetical protein
MTAATQEKLRQAIELVETSTRQVQEHARETRLSFVRIVTLAFEARTGRTPTDAELRADLERFWPGGGATATDAEPEPAPIPPRKAARREADGAFSPSALPTHVRLSNDRKAPGADRLARAHIAAVRNAERVAAAIVRRWRADGFLGDEDDLAAIRGELGHHICRALYRADMQRIGWIYPQGGFRGLFDAEGHWHDVPDPPRIIVGRMRRLPGHLQGDW